MKSTKKEIKKSGTVTVYPKQKNIMVKYNGIKYNFETESVKLPIDVAEYFIKNGIVNSTQEEK